MTVFLTQAEKPDNVDAFQKDSDLLLQLVLPVAELFTRKIDYATTSNH
jgi:hypothetical protein